MPLKGKKPTAITKRFKALFYGTAGAGKTTAAIQFPKPYLIDTERGAENDQYVKILDKQGGAIFQTSDFEEMLSEVKSLLSEKHDYKTLIIDPITVVYNQLLEAAEKKVGSEFGRHYGEANKSMKHLLNLLMRLDMNVIITAHSKNEYGSGMEVVGQTFDGYKKLDYLFDLVIEISKRGKDRIGVVRKSRIESLADLESFPFSYDVIAEKYGKEGIEKESQEEKLATKEQLSEILNLIEILKLDEEIVQKWLDKAKAASLEEMTEQSIGLCIQMLHKKIKGEK